MVPKVPLAGGNNHRTPLHIAAQGQGLRRSRHTSRALLLSRGRIQAGLRKRLRSRANRASLCPCSTRTWRCEAGNGRRRAEPLKVIGISNERPAILSFSGAADVVRRVNRIDRAPGPDLRGRRDLPALQHLGVARFAGEVPRRTERQAMADIERSVPVLRRQISAVLRKNRIQVGRLSVQGMTVGIGGQHGQSVGGALSHNNLERIVVRKIREGSQHLHLRKPRVLHGEGAPRIFSRRGVGYTGSGLVDIDGIEQVLPASTHVIRVDREAIGDGMLNAEAPIHDFRHIEVGRGTSDSAGSFIAARSGQVDEIAQVAKEGLPGNDRGGGE